ncbi:MAG: PilZ domain-containing protein [Spirochaetales bacterium]|jgi:hypothetical protein|nr:PilZ domain-containing protein [Spirochaetales bacterium]
MDNRNHQRFLIQRRVQLRTSSGHVVPGMTRDLSFGGSFIECDTANLQSGEECTLLIMLDDGAGSIEIFGDICYSNNHGVGCQFLTFDSEYYQFLTHYSLESPDS